MATKKPVVIYSGSLKELDASDDLGLLTCDTTNVTAAGALMDSEVDADIKTLSLPASTTISAFGASLVDDAAASNARSTLDVDQAGTDNSTDVTLAGTPDYITISGQVITRGPVNLTTDVTGNLPTSNVADLSGTNTGDEVAASVTVSGIIEIATTAEAETGTDTSRAVTAAGVKAVVENLKKSIVVKCIADDMELDAADGVAQFTVPNELDGWNLISVGAHVYTVSSSGLPTFQIYNLTQTADMLTTKISIDATETDSSTATTAAVIDAANDDVSEGDVIRFDCDIAGTGTAGMEIRLGFQLP